ncbi:uncharacterized protein K452DRAFT_120962 [Aplosporella prunicola CBS 121167]|uniref:Uncharacterized protein n=1 Tax=Aplosporella prunicola CBS 121167 TaxID=1176127 RepID=A0A6A6BMZ8_9PEZI|nr:uncharacterized protein K452DRAFT_120962 [Aplosporella prunicola CBS 121167]KAF2145509.1 hypothetical protein K452DRAFT_120962 [Aplosporella prunicola CBS 121167]
MISKRSIAEGGGTGDWHSQKESSSTLVFTDFFYLWLILFSFGFSRGQRHKDWMGGSGWGLIARLVLFRACMPSGLDGHEVREKAVCFMRCTQGLLACHLGLARRTCTSLVGRSGDGAGGGCVVPASIVGPGRGRGDCYLWMGGWVDGCLLMFFLVAVLYTIFWVRRCVALLAFVPALHCSCLSSFAFATYPLQLR